jgi:imidazole glycerol phosphate synthase subunit HisF
MNQEKIVKGDVVEILKEYQDNGDEELIWVAVDSEEKGRVTVMPINSTLSIKPTYVMNVEWLKVKKRGGGV